MADQIPDFIDGDLNLSNRVKAAWLNDVNDAIYRANTGITGATPNRTLLSKLSDVVSVKDFGAVGDGVTDDTAAISAAITAVLAAAGKLALYAPGGTYLVTSQLTAIPGQFTLYGDGRQQTTFLFRPTVDNVACFKITNGASSVLNIFMRDFGIKSDDTAHTKIALDLYDLSTCEFANIYIYGTGSGTPSAPYFTGNTSIGIRTHGRDSTCIRDIEIVADKPISIEANPNAAATLCEDMDHWRWSNCYLIPKGSYAITVADGLGLQNTVFDGYQAWVGGTGGFLLNDTRAAPTVATHDIAFSDVRAEQGQDVNGYWFNISFAGTAQGAFHFKNVFGASATQGITFTKVARLTLDSVTMATSAGKNALIATPAAIDSVIQMTNCYWQPGSVFTLTDFLPSLIAAWDSTLSQGTVTAIWNYKTAAYRNYWSASPNTQTGATYTVLPVDTDIIANRAGTVTLTLEAASGVPGKRVTVRTIQAQTVVSAASNVVPLVGGSAGTAILAATAGKWATLVSDGTNWQIQAAN